MQAFEVISQQTGRSIVFVCVGMALYMSKQEKGCHKIWSSPNLKNLINCNEKKKMWQLIRCKCITSLAHRDHIILDQAVALDSLTVFKASRAEDHIRNGETLFTTMMLDAQTQSRWMDIVSLKLQLLMWRCCWCYHRYNRAPVYCLCIYVLQPEEVYELLFHQANLCCIMMIKLPCTLFLDMS